MTQDHEEPVRRRPDGSIDIDFYAHRAARLRHSALREKPAGWLAHSGWLIARLIGNIARTSRTPH
ncbi:hypothetical protein [Neorhizobium sp. DT-125]|uniref:hypothetical protein n=1 Tax=Neorhizobium sp. DT-125 TaxID=3396163 RepID=UPI003F1CC17E